MSIIEAVYVGPIRLLDPEGHPTGIYKDRVDGPIRVGPAGIAGDHQADRRVHGGPEKAVHHYAADHYPVLARAHPGAAVELVPGSLGENLSSRGLTEHQVHIGDVFRIGTALLQVSQPRSPCWKINHRFGVDRLSRTIADARLTGWYYRVLEPGLIEAGDPLTLVERAAEPFSIDRFWRIQLVHRPDLAVLAALAATPGLAPDWQRRFATRLDWLRGHGALATP